MGNCYFVHIAKDYIHTDITCNIEEPQLKYCLGTVSNNYRVAGGGLGTVSNNYRVAGGGA